MAQPAVPAFDSPAGMEGVVSVVPLLAEDS